MKTNTSFVPWTVTNLCFSLAVSLHHLCTLNSSVVLPASDLFLCTMLVPRLYVTNGK